MSFILSRFTRILLLFILIFSQNLILASVRKESVSPSHTDSQIKTFISDSHRIYFNLQSQQRNQLLVYLPASFDEANSSNAFCTIAAASGYRVISLTYPGTDKMYSTCEHSTDPPCYENFHREIAEGKNYSSWIQVDSTEGIFYRLKSLLIYLNKKYPQEGWLDYLTSSLDINHGRIIWSGHSDGAGHAAVIAKYYAVLRAICFSGPKDFSLHYYLPPIWMHTGSWKTDKKNIYTFSHISDEYLFQKEIWDSLGLMKYGVPVNIDQVPYPYQQSHQLVTAYNVAIGDRHGCTVQDQRTPILQGVPLFEAAWKYLLDIMSISTSLQYAVIKSPKVYPNPVQIGGNIYLDAEESWSKLEVVSAKGEMVYTSNGNNKKITLRGLTIGLYFIRTYYPTNQIKTSKFIVN